MSARFLIANWKMNLPPEGIEKYLAELAHFRHESLTTIVAPPYPYLHEMRGMTAAAQNCAEQLSGAFTGEVSPAMLRDLGVGYVIIGHSERRNLFGEGEAAIARKLALAIETGLIPVLCVGEDLHTRDAGHAARFLAGQIKAAAVPQLESSAPVLVAYEPIWAIGTGRNATGEICAETCDLIRGALARFWPSQHAAAPILYGGSVTPENAGDLVDAGGVDGFLVGGASLDSGKMRAIARGLVGS